MAKRRTKQSDDLNSILLGAFERSGMNRNQLAHAAELPYAVVHGWVGGTRTLNLGSADKIAKVLGLTLKKV